MNEEATEHDPLPWYVNRTLSPSESVAFEKHLAGCDRCRDDLERLSMVRRCIVESGDDIFVHPDAESLTAAALAEKTFPADPSILRHVEACPQCALEAGWIRGQPPAAAVRPDLVRSVARPRIARRAMLAAALVLAIVGGASMAWLAMPRRGATRSLDAYVLDSAVRTDGITTIEPPPSATGFSLVVRVDYAPRDLPLEIQISNGAGATIFEGEHDRPLLQGMFLLLYCDIALFPDGDYVLRIRSSSETERVTEYRFRIERAATAA